MTKINCTICGENHATFEHRIYSKLKLMELGEEVSWLTMDKAGTHIERLVNKPETML